MILEYIRDLIEADGTRVEMLEDNTIEVIVDDHVAQVQLIWEDIYP